MNKNDIQLIIPMSGLGKRFQDAGYKEPKPLIKVGQKPIIQHVVELFPGISDISFICNEEHLKNTDMRSVLLSIAPDCKVYPIERKRGPVEAVVQILDKIDDNKEVIVSYCDYGTYWEFNGFIEYARTSNSDGCIACYTGFHPHMLGSDNYAFCKKDGENVIEVREKQPFTDNKMQEHASNGTYYFKNGAILKKYFLSLIDKEIQVNNEFYVSLVYNLMINDGLKVTIYLIEHMLQWGTPNDLEEYVGWSKCFRKLKTFNNTAKNPINTTLIMPMAGNGARFFEKGFDVPKPLIPINGRPMVINAMSYLPKADDYAFLCRSEHITNYNINTELLSVYPNSKIIQIKETTEGQACTCNLVIENLDQEKPIFISSCDNGALYDCDYYNSLVKDESIDVIIWSFRNNQTSRLNPDMYSWIDVDENNFATNISTKKFNQTNPLESHAIIGTFFFRKTKHFTEAFNYNYSNKITTNKEYYVDDIVKYNVLSGLSVKVFEVDHYIGWGTPNDYLTYKYWSDYFGKTT